MDVGLEALRDRRVRGWFSGRFPAGPTPAQARAWPAIAAGRNVLISAPTGTGKTLAAFLALIDALHREHEAETLSDGLRCVYVSPLRSLGYDVEANLARPLREIASSECWDASPVRVAVRTGDTSPHARRRLRERPPHILITTPESLALLLAQPSWAPLWRGVRQVVVDEIHALMPTKRGADLAVSLERLAAAAMGDPRRIGLSATCRPLERVGRFLAGMGREVELIDAGGPEDDGPLELAVESLLRADEGPHRGLTYRRLLRRLNGCLDAERTTVVFANTRAFAEKITHDLRLMRPGGDGTIAAHHSALDAARRREIERALRAGELRAVVTSTSLELGVDIGTADRAVLVGLPGSVARCLQRVGRSGRRRGAARRGLMLAATAAEVAGAAVTAEGARRGAIEPLRWVEAPLDVLAQQILGIACGGEGESEMAYALVRRATPFAGLSRRDFDDCLAYLAGELAAPAGAMEAERPGGIAWTAPRLWKSRGAFGLRSGRVRRWLWMNVGTIASEETARVEVEGRPIGTLEAAYAERLQAGDRFVLDGRALEVAARRDGVIAARAAAGEVDLPRWTSDRQSLSAELAAALASFREEAATRLVADGPTELVEWLGEAYRLPGAAGEVLAELLLAQAVFSEIPPAGGVLVEEWPHAEGYAYAFHAPLCRAACEAAGRAVAARLGRRFGRNVGLKTADLGWSVAMEGDARIGPADVEALLAPEGFEADVLEGLDRGELLARRFRLVAGTALMILRRPEGGRLRVGGLGWASQRLYPLVKAACPDHPLLRETRREVLVDLLDAPGAMAWLRGRGPARFRALEAASPFAAAWIDPAAGGEALRFESPEEALGRLHRRLLAGKG
jgi:ATP-dependent Lhr-like helicase